MKETIPILFYCGCCGRAIYADEYCETVDVFRICEECQEDMHREELEWEDEDINDELRDEFDDGY